MIQKTQQKFIAGFVFTISLLVVLILATTISVANAQKRSVVSNVRVAVPQQPLYTEYRGVRIGMKAQEVRAKLGEPLQKADDADLYAFSDNELAQIAYDASHSVVTVSVDYIGGGGAPDYKSVVGSDVQMKPDGSIYKLVRYDGLGLWVYYNRTGGEVPIVTITLQKSLVG